jgi:hypothetical protein
MERGIVRVRVGLSYDPLRLSPCSAICDYRKPRGQIFDQKKILPRTPPIHNKQHKTTHKTKQQTIQKAQTSNTANPKLLLRWHKTGSEQQTYLWCCIQKKNNPPRKPSFGLGIYNTRLIGRPEKYYQYPGSEKQTKVFRQATLLAQHYHGSK